jgi:hypothetical protein
MPLQFTVLASGSAGNASLVRADGFGVLLDAGLGPRQLAARLAAVGASWQDVHAVLLTHTHSDHWRDRTFAHLHRLGISVYCHADHRGSLLAYSAEFAALLDGGLVRGYESAEEFAVGPRLRCLPIPLHHDGGPTFGFRIEGPADLFGEACALGYVADLGSWTPELARSIADVDLLALEFNHDVGLECSSGRSARLIARILGDHGHLSNDQAAALLVEVLRLSTPGRLRHMVQLHLSRDCNCPALAAKTARAVLAAHPAGVQLHTACQDRPGPCVTIGGPAVNGRAVRRPPVRRSPAQRERSNVPVQSLLPGME